MAGRSESGRTPTPWSSESRARSACGSPARGRGGSLVVAGVIALFIWLVTVFSVILIPFLVGILVSALLVPISTGCSGTTWPKWLAVVMSLLGGIAVLGGLIWLVVDQIIASSRRCVTGPSTSTRTSRTSS